MYEGMNSNLNPYYISGLVDGEGCFSITFNKKKDIKRPEVRLIFEIELREDDLEILQRIRDRLKCGNIYHLKYERYAKWRPHYKYKVSNLRDITQKIIPFFEKYPLQARKKYNFAVFCKVASLILAKEHLTEEGVRKIRKLKQGVERDSLDALDTHVQ